jgi:hypothetical protein
MNSGALFIIASDPRASGRPAEAVRIAAGVAAWRKVDVAVYLRGAAVLILGENAGELVDGENYTRYLPALRDLRRPVYAQKGAAMLPGPGPAAPPFEEISDAQLAAMAAARRCVLRF